MTYDLIHDDNGIQQSFDSFTKAQKSYYFQWRNDDGSIPYKIFCGEYEIDPSTGNITS